MPIDNSWSSRLNASFKAKIKALVNCNRFALKINQNLRGCSNLIHGAMLVNKTAAIAMGITSCKLAAPSSANGPSSSILW